MGPMGLMGPLGHMSPIGDRKSTRLNSSHLVISYAVFCLKKKILRMDHLPAPHGRIPRSSLLGRSPRRGDFRPTDDLGEGPRRRPGDLALHDAHSLRYPPP